MGYILCLLTYLSEPLELIHKARFSILLHTVVYSLRIVLKRSLVSHVSIALLSIKNSQVSTKDKLLSQL